MFCEGQLLPISENETLFNLIGTTYGGDGQSTFALPDLRGRLPIHMGSGFTMAETGGVEEVTLTVPQIPGHLHAELVTDPAAVCPAVQRALASGGPSVVAIKVDRDLERAGPDKTGWWDVPVSEAHPESRAEQLAGRAEEQQL